MTPTPRKTDVIRERDNSFKRLGFLETSCVKNSPRAKNPSNNVIPATYGHAVGARIGSYGSRFDEISAILDEIFWKKTIEILII